MKLGRDRLGFQLRGACGEGGMVILNLGFGFGVEVWGLEFRVGGWGLGFGVYA